jgi:hypothetical protein
MTSHETQTDHPESSNATVSPPENPKKPMRHEQYLEHLETQFSCRLDEVEIIIKTQFYEKQLHILVHLDLDPAIPILTSLYSPGKLKDARDPPSMLRSLILMLLLGFSSITQWVRRTKEDAFIAVLIGFEPGDVPGVGTYYGFMARIVNGPYRKPCRCKGIVKRSDYNIGPHLRNFKNEKKDKKAAKNDLDPYHSKSEKLAASLLADARGARVDNLYKILEDIHIKIGVIPSIREGLISDLHDLVTSGDGSIGSSFIENSHPAQIYLNFLRFLWSVNLILVATFPPLLDIISGRRTLADLSNCRPIGLGTGILLHVGFPLT